MAIVDLVMPKMGESIMEATILKWHKAVGDVVEMDETILEIATDKVDSEVPSTAAGTITEILFEEDDVVPVGTVIVKIETDADVEVAASPTASTPTKESAAPAAETTAPVTKTEDVNIPSNRFYSPLVLNIAATENISMAELENLPGSGKDGRVTKKDILAHVAQRGQAPVAATTAPQAAPATQAQAQATPAQTTTNYGDNVEIVAMDRMRKLIAKHMVNSVQTSPHVTSFTEADVTDIVNWRNKHKGPFKAKYGENITFTPIFIEAVVNSIKKFPLINVSVDGDNLIIKKDINIGMAAALPSGNLIVPVIKNADTRNLLGLSKEVNRLANAARNNKLKADETSGSTFTLTNVGTFGSLMGTPIINQPEVAILAVGTIKKRPMVLETEQGDVIAIRHMMYLSLSYDHRVVDGSLGASFLTEVGKQLEAFDTTREI